MERERGMPKLTIAALCFSAGINLANIAHAVQDDSEKDYTNAQIYNQQVLDHLGDNYPDIEDLVLEEGKEFTFSISQDGEEKTCTGEYEVTQGTATAIGEIVCSVATPIGTTVTTLE